MAPTAQVGQMGLLSNHHHHHHHHHHLSEVNRRLARTEYGSKKQLLCGKVGVLIEPQDYYE
jgi:hypothetical protein